MSGNSSGIGSSGMGLVATDVMSEADVMPPEDGQEGQVESQETESPCPSEVLVLPKHIRVTEKISISRDGEVINWSLLEDSEVAPVAFVINKGDIFPVHGWEDADEESKGDAQINTGLDLYDESSNEDYWDGIFTLQDDEWVDATEEEYQAFVSGEGEKQATPESTVTPPTAAATAKPGITLAEAFRELQAHVRQVHGISDDLADARAEEDRKVAAVQRAKNELSEARERVRELTDQLNEVAAAAPNPDRYPLFDRNGESDLPMGVVADGGEAVAVATETTESDTDDTWKDIQIEALGLSTGLNDKLHDAEIATIGDLAAYTAEVPLTGIKGIGQGAQAKIEDALEVFWTERARKQEAAKLDAEKAVDDAVEANEGEQNYSDERLEPDDFSQI